MALNVDDMWSLDDFQRRVMMNLFSDQVSPGEAARRRSKRRELVLLLDGIEEDNYVKIDEASQQLCQLARLAPVKATKLDPATPDVPDYSQPRDQVVES
jgi:hypothetical protein